MARAMAKAGIGMIEPLHEIVTYRPDLPLACAAWVGASGRMVVNFDIFRDRFFLIPKGRLFPEGHGVDTEADAMLWLVGDEQ